MVYLGELERKKRRFAVYLSGEVAIGVECDDWSWGTLGLGFYGVRKESRGTFVVCAVAPGHYLSFYELADGDGWPEPVEFILSEEGRRKK